jgi:hypothetical protein
MLPMLLPWPEKQWKAAQVLVPVVVQVQVQVVVLLLLLPLLLLLLSSSLGQWLILMLVYPL